VGLESEGAGHSAASRIRRLHFGARLSKQRLFGAELHDRLVMAVAVEQYLPCEPRWLVLGPWRVEKLGEKDGLAGQTRGAGIVGEQVAQLVAEHGGTARLEHDDGNACVDDGAERCHDVPQVSLRVIEESEIVKWPAA